MTQEFLLKNIYRDLQLINRGAIGEVYRAVGPGDRPVAIKRLRPHLAYDRPEVEKIIREAKILRRLNHPAFPKLIEACSEGEEAFLVLEWLEGKPLDSFFETIPLGLERERWGAIFILSLLEALSYLQKLTSPDGEKPGLIHADLNPNNVLVSGTGKAKIFDFSHAVWVEEGGISLGGTWAYMTLKQLKEKNLTIHTDLFAAGLLLSEALLGEPALKGKTTLMVYLSTVDFDPKKASQEATHDPQLQEILEGLFRCLHEDKKNPTEDIIEKLKIFIGELD